MLVFPKSMTLELDWCNVILLRYLDVVSTHLQHSRSSSRVQIVSYFMAPATKPRRNCESWASTQRKTTPKVPLPVSVQPVRPVNRADPLDTGRPESSGALKEVRKTIALSAKKLPPPPDACEEILEEYALRTKKNSAPAVVEDVPAGCTSPDFIGTVESPGMLPYYLLSTCRVPH